MLVAIAESKQKASWQKLNSAIAFLLLLTPKNRLLLKKKMSFLISFLSDPALVCLLCAAVLLAVVYFSTGYKNSAFKLPPGPTPLPIIGNLHLVDLRRQDKSLMKVGKKTPNPDPHRF